MTHLAISRRAGSGLRRHQRDTPGRARLGYGALSQTLVPCGVDPAQDGHGDQLGQSRSLDREGFRCPS